MKGERFSWAQKHKDQTIITWYKSLSTEFPTQQIYNYTAEFFTPHETR